MLVKNGTLFTMVEEEGLIDYDLRIREKKIVEIGQNLQAENGEKVLDLHGAWVLPGFIESHCHIGVDEYGLGKAGDDCNESSSPVTPEVNAIDGINPADEAFQLALEAGVTTVFTGPGSASVLGGRFACLRTWGKSVDKMLIPEAQAMKCAFGENPKRVYGSQKKAPITRLGTGAIMRQSLNEARYYKESKELAAQKGEPFKENLAMENLLPVLERKIPLKAHAHRADDILSAIRIAREYNVLLTLDHCTEGHYIVDEIAESTWPALLGPSMSTTGKAETAKKSYETAIALTKAGVLCSVITDHPVTRIELLPVCAGMVHRLGLSLVDSLRLITLNPAKILGLDEQMGSLEVGKLANITIYDGNPLSNLSHCLCTIGEGEILHQVVASAKTPVYKL